MSNVYRAVEEALVLVLGTSIHDTPWFSVISTIKEIYSLPPLATPQQFEGLVSVEMKVIGDMHLVIEIGYVRSGEVNISRVWCADQNITTRGEKTIQLTQ